MRRLVRSTALPIQAGVGLTALIACLVLLAGVSDTCDAAGRCQPRWQQLAAAPANQFGDVLSGVGSVLAFIWLIVTVWLQAIELRLQREDIKAQHAEARRMAEAMDKQARIFAQEQKERAEDRADKELDALIDRFLNAAGYIRGLGHDGPFFPAEQQRASEERRFDACLDHLIAEVPALLAAVRDGRHIIPVEQADTRQAHLYLSEIVAIRPRLSRSSQIWLTKFEVDAALAALGRLMAEPAYWSRETA